MAHLIASDKYGRPPLLAGPRRLRLTSGPRLAAGRDDYVRCPVRPAEASEQSGGSARPVAGAVGGAGRRPPGAGDGLADRLARGVLGERERRRGIHLEAVPAPVSSLAQVDAGHREAQGLGERPAPSFHLAHGSRAPYRTSYRAVTAP
jgi:hypothetical protein